MKILLDTNVVIELLRGNAAVHKRLRAHDPKDVGLPSIALHGLYYGAWRGSRHADNVARVDALRFPVVEFDAQDARAAGEIRAALADGDRTIGGYDVLIAGQALSRSLTLVTANTREFERVAGLGLEIWEI